MYKLFTLDEAKALIPIVDGHLRELQTAVGDLVASQEALARAKPLSLEAKNLQEEIKFLLSDIQNSKAELDRLGVFLKDIEAGVVDFPSQVGAEVVYLAWRQGQPTITHYHRVTGEQPQALPSQFSPERAIGGG